MQRQAGIIALMAAVLAVTGGCGRTSATTNSAPESSAYVLPAEPQGSIGVLDARTRDVDGQEVVLVGRIGGVPNPWVQGYASFIVSDLGAPDATAHKHADGCDCKFCAQKHRAADSIAVVEIVDGNGHLLRTDAQQLLGLKAGQTVVVRGRARVDSLGCMTLATSGVYIRR